MYPRWIIFLQVSFVLALGVTALMGCKLKRIEPSTAREVFADKLIFHSSTDITSTAAERNEYLTAGEALSENGLPNTAWTYIVEWRDKSVDDPLNAMHSLLVQYGFRKVNKVDEVHSYLGNGDKIIVKLIDPEDPAVNPSGKKAAPADRLFRVSVIVYPRPYVIRDSSKQEANAEGEVPVKDQVGK